MSGKEILLNLAIGTAGSLLAAAIWKLSPKVYLFLKQIPIKAASRDVVGKAKIGISNVTANNEILTRASMAFWLLTTLLLIGMLITSLEFDPTRANFD